MTTPMEIPLRHIAAGRFDAALRLLAEIPLGSPGRDAALGAVYLGRKQAALALDHLKRACTEAPDELAVRLLLGRAHMLAADPGSAIAVFEQIPGADEALAGAYRRDARYGDAVWLVQGHSDPSDQMLYELAMSLGCLGDAHGCLETWDRLIQRAPNLAAAWYGSHAPALELIGWTDAERRIERAIACPKANGKYRAMLAAYDVLAGRAPHGFSAKHAHVARSVGALVPDLDPDVRLFGLAHSLLRWAVGQSQRAGLVLEFGVRRGTSLNTIAAVAGQAVHGFDSFEGLPEAWNGAAAGVLTTYGALPIANGDIHLHPGWFENTLPGFLARHPGPVRFANIDCDIYSSTRTVLTALAERIQPGTVLVFDEFIGNRSWADDEYRAFQEFVAAFCVRYRIVAVNPACKQVAIKVNSVSMKTR